MIPNKRVRLELDSMGRWVRITTEYAIGVHSDGRPMFEEDQHEFQLPYGTCPPPSEQELTRRAVRRGMDEADERHNRWIDNQRVYRDPWRK